MQYFAEMLCFYGRQPHSKVFFSLAALPQERSASNTQLHPTPMLGTARTLQSCMAGNPNTERLLCFFKTVTENFFFYFPKKSQCHTYIFHLKTKNNKKSDQPGLSQGCLINSFHCYA